jgi:hypothetical protein
MEDIVVSKDPDGDITNRHLVVTLFPIFILFFLPLSSLHYCDEQV